jgi:secreted PhoX family phosphatase
MSSKLHPDGKFNPSSSVTNESQTPNIFDVVDSFQAQRRAFVKNALGASALAFTGGFSFESLANSASQPLFTDTNSAPPKIGFTSVPPNLIPMVDAVTVPKGYQAQVLVAWGDSLTQAPHWDARLPMDETTQLHCYGAHTDGMHFFPKQLFGKTVHGNQSGVLVSNSEYVDPALLNAVAPAANYATTKITIEMVRAQQAAHGVNVLEIEKKSEKNMAARWQVNRASTFNRRITSNTLCAISGPAAGAELLKTSQDISGKKVLGTLSNCSNGYTPWGTYLTCEENFHGYFGSQEAGFTPNALEKRYGITAKGFGIRWHEVDSRFDLAKNRHEPNRFGWVVEIDPMDPTSTPIKRTAMGRFKHENAGLSIDKQNNVAFYMGDDERNEYVYKFVCNRQYNANNRRANQDMLDDGILYVAKFNADGTGVWMPLVFGQSGLTVENGFVSQADILIRTRQAADFLGATMMDRPEWTAVHPHTGEVYLTLTNNSQRGYTPVSENHIDGTKVAASAKPPVDAANPRPDNDFGHIIRWRETDNTVRATTFVWDIFAQCGDKNSGKTLSETYLAHEFNGQNIGYQGNIKGDDIGAPDGLWLDHEGRLWVLTDQAGDAKGDWKNIGTNSMSCVDTLSGEFRRFLTAPPHAEVTGITATPDGKTFFVGIQHPGEDWENTFTENSSWPDNGANGETSMRAIGAIKPRSGIVVITKEDGGVIGT